MRIYKDFLLSEILYYKIGGKARYVLKIEDREGLLEALDFVQKNQIKKILPIGLGSNLLVSDDFFDGAVLWFSGISNRTGLKTNYSSSERSESRSFDSSRQARTIDFAGSNLTEVFASVILDDLIQFAFNKNLIGLEWAGGLPSTIGGAVRGNAGAFGGEIGKSIDKIEVFEAGYDGEFVQKILKASQLKFGYRDSLIKKKKNLIISSSFFKLTPTDNKSVEHAKQIYLSNIEYRNKKHPLEFPSCGSVFKNIRDKEKVLKIINKWYDIQELVESKWYGKVSMGYVIDRLGFSGYKMGGAEVSKKHANYIVNIGGAKFIDVCSIIEKIKEKFYKTFGFFPELEVEIVE